MIHLFVIADDFTGALDTGVQFASYGAATKVVVGTGLQALEADAQTQVLVVDAETRHLPAAQGLFLLLQDFPGPADLLHAGVPPGALGKGKKDRMHL